MTLLTALREHTAFERGTVVAAANESWVGVGYAKGRLVAALSRFPLPTPTPEKTP